MSSDSAAISGATILIVLFIGLIAYVINSWLMSVVFQKMNIAPWKAWVPFYNTWVFLEDGGYSGALMLLALIPGASIVVAILMVLAAHRIGEGFGHDAGMTVLYFFLPIVWFAIIGFGSSQWGGLRNGVLARESAAGANAVLQRGGYPGQGYGQPGMYQQQPQNYQGF